jgi:hypothetical protein
MLLWLYTHVSIVCFMCFSCFHTYVSSVSSRCFRSISGCCITCTFQVFHTYVASVSSKCCKSIYGCSIWCYGYTHMFQVFHLFSVICCKCFNWEHMLQRPWSLGNSGLPQLPATVAGPRRGSPCERQRPKDTFATRIRRPVRRARSCLLPPYYTGATGAMREWGAASEHLLRLDVVGC